MPLRRGRAKAKPASDPLTACLDANGTYICTSFNPRCYIIQKVTTSTPQSSNNEWETVESNIGEDPQSSANCNSIYEQCSQDSSSEGYRYLPAKLMNGNVSQPIAPRAVYNGHLHIAAMEGTLDTLLSSERIEDEKYEDEVIHTSRPPGVPVEFSKETLKKTLRKQLDFYFSTQNLASDGYLLSQMDKEQFVPIWTLANFNMIKKLTNDIELITEVLSECTNVQLNESRTKVRPNYQRCVVILREIPGDTPLDDVKKLFTGEGCPSFISCEFAGNDAWYITFSTDDDAQKAYTYLRETVKVFRGKPIHARIKAKPMRTPSSGNVQSGVGYKSNWTAPPASTVFDPSTFSSNQQRYMFTNGTPAQLPYHSQVYFPPFQPQTGQLIQTYVPATHWPASYYDINTVFQVNGLSPQPPYKTSYKNNGKSKKKSAGQSEQGAAATCSSAARQPQPHMSAVNRTNANSRVNEIPEAPLPIPVPYVHHPLPLLDMTTYGYVPQPLAMTKEPVPPRHRRRRRDDENAAGPSQSQEVEQRTFDLGHSAFPPLKTNTRRTNNNSTANQEDSSNLDQPAPQTTDTMPWSDHRIVDILRGNAASKSSSTSTSSKGSLSANDNESPRAGSPQMNEIRDVAEGVEVALSSALTLTPPVSPEKNQDAKCTMTDKSTKTDEVIPNGEAEVCPTTTNAATMTTIPESSTARTDVPKPTTSSNTPPRMSYAQVAQHAKEGGGQKDKKETVSTDGEPSSSAAAAPVQNGDKKGKDKQEKSQRNRPGPSRPSGTSNGQQRNDKKKQNGKKNPRSK